MLVTSISTTTVNKLNKPIIRTTNYGRYGDYHIAVDNFIQDGKITEKRIVVWNDYMQRIVNKFRKQDGKGFDVVW